MLKRVPQIKHYLQCLPLAVLTLFIKFSCSLSLQIPPTYSISTFSLKYASILTHNVSSVNIYLMDILIIQFDICFSITCFGTAPTWLLHSRIPTFALLFYGGVYRVDGPCYNQAGKYKFVYNTGCVVTVRGMNQMSKYGLNTAMKYGEVKTIC